MCMKELGAKAMMRNNIVLFFFIFGILGASPVVVNSSGAKHLEPTEITEPGKGNFEKDTADASATIRQNLRTMRNNKFFTDLFQMIDGGNVKSAEGILQKRSLETPAIKDDAAYIVAKSKIDYVKKDYSTAYAEADKFVTKLEVAFAPRKPYEIAFKDRNELRSVQYAYILRYQASAAMQHYEESLADLDCALKMETNSGLLRAKTGALIALNRFPEAAAAADMAYSLDPQIFVSSPYRNHYCTLFREHELSVKSCKYFDGTKKQKTDGEKNAK